MNGTVAPSASNWAVATTLCSVSFNSLAICPTKLAAVGMFGSWLIVLSNLRFHIAVHLHGNAPETNPET